MRRFSFGVLAVAVVGAPLVGCTRQATRDEVVQQVIDRTGMDQDVAECYVDESIDQVGEKVLTDQTPTSAEKVQLGQIALECTEAGG